MFNEKDFEATGTQLYSQFIHKSRYARWKDEEKRRENWDETVNRYLSFFVAKYPKLEKEIVALGDPILKCETMPSMRCLMTAGEALERDNIAGFNCSYVVIDHPRAFDEMMYILMCGTGVGFSVERQYVNKLPEIAESLEQTNTVIVVGDSKVGWAKAFKELISLLYAGQIPTWDLSKVRPAGAKLKTFGGRASGPGPLEDLFRFSVALFKRAQGRRLTSIECHDLCCKIAEIVVVGGVRRSALISLSNPSDDRMRVAKSGQWWESNGQRALANNSAAYTEKPDFETFLKEWLSLYESKSGERGFFSRIASKKQAEKTGRRDPNFEFGTNPCCFTGDMKLLTENGYVDFKSLSQVDSINIVNKDGSVTKGKVWSSGIKPTVSISFESRLNKKPITVTGDHRFMLTDGSECEAKDLKSKRVMPYFTIKQPVKSDAFLLGFILGDGNLGRLSQSSFKSMEVYFGENDKDIADMFGQDIGKWQSKYAYMIAKKHNMPAMSIGSRGLPEACKNLESISGLYSANGSVIKGSRVALKSIDKAQIIEVQKILASIGINSYYTTNKKKLNVFSNGEYECKESYDLNIGQFDSIVRFAELISFGHQYKREALKALILNKAPKVKNVQVNGEEEVFDFTEPQTHWGVVEGCVVHNSEIILRPNQFCNLSEVVVRAEDDFESLSRKVRAAAALGTLQATLTDFRYLRSIWKKNTEDEALLGVSMTGIMDHAILGNPDHPELDSLLEALKNVAIEENKKWAEKLGINPSAAITCVKPSGTVSQLVNSASGIHPRFAKYYIRRVRADVKDPLAQFMRDRDFPCETDVINSSNLVFSFPVKAPEHGTVVKDVGAMHQLKLWKKYQDHWCEHKPSITVYYTDNEFMEIGNWMWNNFDAVSGISFLPHSEHNYRQAPYEEISEDDYQQLLQKMPSGINWEELALYEDDDNTEGTQTLACTGGVCDIVDLAKKFDDHLEAKLDVDHTSATE